MPTNDTDVTPVFATTAEVAAATHLSVRAVIRRVERGQLVPAQKLPGLRGAYLFDRADIDALTAEKAS